MWASRKTLGCLEMGGSDLMRPAPHDTPATRRTELYLLGTRGRPPTLTSVCVTAPARLAITCSAHAHLS
eukprot:6111898-Prymnesium_polylepis.2